MKTTPATSLDQFQPGQTIRPASGNGEALIVHANYGFFAIAARTMHIANPTEWVLVDPGPPAIPLSEFKDMMLAHLDQERHPPQNRPERSPFAFSRELLPFPERMRLAKEHMKPKPYAPHPAITEREVLADSLLRNGRTIDDEITLFSISRENGDDDQWFWIASVSKDMRISQGKASSPREALINALASAESAMAFTDGQPSEVRTAAASALDAALAEDEEVADRPAPGTPPSQPQQAMQREHAEGLTVDWSKWPTPKPVCTCPRDEETNQHLGETDRDCPLHGGADPLLKPEEVKAVIPLAGPLPTTETP